MYNSSLKGEVCSHNFSFILDNFIRRIFQNPQKIVGPYICPGDIVLDLGCGPGYFSIDMASMVGKTGRVFAVDLQKEMLDKVARKAKVKNLSQVIRLHQCSQDRIGLDSNIKADFILAYYMVHETRNHEEFLAQVKELLSPKGQFLVVEPPFHVSKQLFKKITRTALDTGFVLKERPRKKGGRSLLLTLKS